MGDMIVAHGTQVMFFSPPQLLLVRCGCCACCCHLICPCVPNHSATQSQHKRVPATARCSRPTKLASATTTKAARGEITSVRRVTSHESSAKSQACCTHSPLRLTAKAWAVFISFSELGGEYQTSRYSSHKKRHTGRVTHHASHIPHHASHITHHTSSYRPSSSCA